MSFSQKVRWLRRKASQQIAAREWLLRLSSTMTTIIFPILEGILINLLTAGELRDSLWALFWFIAGIHAFLAVAQLLLVYGPDEALSLLDEAADKDNERLIVSGQRDSFLAAIDQTSDGMEVLKQIADFRPSEELPDPMVAILSSFIQRHEEILGVKTTRFFSLAVYQYSKKNEELQVAYRWYDSGMVVENRPWKVGVGHVGQVFANRMAHFSGDLLDLDFHKPDRDSDRRQYRSAASLPIDRNGQPWGVLALTTGTPGQLIEQLHGPALELLVDAIEVFLAYPSDRYAELQTGERAEPRIYRLRETVAEAVSVTVGRTEPA